MGKQYEWDLKIIKELLKNKPQSKQEIKDKLVNKKANGKYDKTSENSFSLTYQTLHNVNVLIKQTLNPKYYKAYDPTDIEYIAISLAGNIQDYRGKYDLFIDDLKGIYCSDEIKRFNNIQKTLGRHLSSNKFELFERTHINEGKCISDDDKKILEITFKKLTKNDYELLSNIAFSRKAHKVELDLQIKAIDDLLNRFINDFQDENPIELDETYKVPIKSQVKRVEENEETGIKIYSVREPKKHNINEYVFKDTLKFILNKSLLELNTKEIYEIIRTNYIQYFDFDEDKIDEGLVSELKNYEKKSLEDKIKDMKDTSDSRQGNIVSDVVNALELLQIITSKKKTHKNYHICQIMKLDSKIYEMSLLTKVETIENLLSGLRNLSEKDITPEEYDTILKIFNYSAKNKDKT